MGPGGNIHENFVYQPYLRIWHQKQIPSPPKAMSKFFFHNKKLWSKISNLYIIHEVIIMLNKTLEIENKKDL